MKRKDALNLIRYAGYHLDLDKAIRVYVENRISYQVYVNTYREGIEAKLSNLPCTCSICNS